MITGNIELHGEGVDLKLDITESTVSVNASVVREKLAFNSLSESPVVRGLLDTLAAYFVSLTAQQAQQQQADPSAFMVPEGYGDPRQETPEDYGMPHMGPNYAGPEAPLDGSPGPG